MSTQKPSQSRSEPGQLQRPATHGTPSGQAWPQPPQWLGSIDVSTQSAPQSVRSGGHIAVLHTPPSQI